MALTWRHFYVTHWWNTAKTYNVKIAYKKIAKTSGIIFIFEPIKQNNKQLFMRLQIK